MIYTIDRLNQMIIHVEKKTDIYDNYPNNYEKFFVKGRIDWLFVVY
jgi:hypothetical protein